MIIALLLGAAMLAPCGACMFDAGGDHRVEPDCHCSPVAAQEAACADDGVCLSDCDHPARPDHDHSALASSRAPQAKRLVAAAASAQTAVLSPVVAGQTIYPNLQDIDDSTGVRVAYPVPGFVWVTFVQAGTAVLRGVAGAFELLPGIGLLFFDAELDPLFDPAEDNEALVEFDWPVYRLKFGVNYTSAGY